MRVKYNGIEHTLGATQPSDMVAFERLFQRRSAAMFPIVVDPSGAVYQDDDEDAPNYVPPLAAPDKDGTPAPRTEPEPGDPVLIENPDFRLEYMYFTVHRGLVRLGVLPRGAKLDDTFIDSVEMLTEEAPAAPAEPEAEDPTTAPAASRTRRRS